MTVWHPIATTVQCNYHTTRYISDQRAVQCTQALNAGGRRRLTANLRGSSNQQMHLTATSNTAAVNYKQTASQTPDAKISTPAGRLTDAWQHDSPRRFTTKINTLFPTFIGSTRSNNACSFTPRSMRNWYLEQTQTRHFYLQNGN